MNRRQFLTGASAIAVASALPAALPAATPTGVFWDLASGPDRTALWIIESNPGGFNMWRRMWETSQMIDGVVPEYEATFVAYEPRFAAKPEWVEQTYPIVHAKGESQWLPTPSKEATPSPALPNPNWDQPPAGASLPISTTWTSPT